MIGSGPPQTSPRHAKKGWSRTLVHKLAGPEDVATATPGPGVGEWSYCAGVDPGRQLRIARLARGVSQQQLAAGAGVSVRTVRSIENGSGRPRRHSLESIARALGFTAAQMRQLVALWAPARGEMGMGAVVARGLDLDAYLGGGGRALNVDTRVVSATNHLFLGPLRQPVKLVQDLLLESRRGRVGDHWLLWGNDPDADITPSVQVGGSTGVFVSIDDFDLLALRVALDPVLRPGEIHRVSVVWDMVLRAEVADPEALNEFAMGWRDTPHLTTVAVTFQDELPTGVQTIAGTREGTLGEQDPLMLDPTGTASVTRHAEQPGMLGLRWDWPGL